MQNYIIMHKDKRVASIRSDGSCRIYSHRFMPYNLYLVEKTNDLDDLVNNINNFIYWCATRMLTMDRKYAKEILNSLGKKQAVTDRDRAEIAISYHALSLTDVYWVRRYREHARFRDINLFEHPLSDSFIDVSLRGRSLTAQKSGFMDPGDYAGDVSTQGVAPKAWRRKDGIFYLLKNGDVRDVRAELLASRILDCFKIDHIHYEHDVYDGIEVSSSELITSLDKSIMAVEFIQIYAENLGQDFYKMVIDKDPYAYYSMNIADYLLGNNDRHWGNWGFWIDNDTNEMQTLYPLMDFNKAFMAYDTIDGIRCQTTPDSISQKDAAIEAVKKVGLNQIAEVKKEWFYDDVIWEMFNKRLSILKSI